MCLPLVIRANAHVPTFSDGSSEGSLAVVHMPNSSDVDVRLVSGECL